MNKRTDQYSGDKVKVPYGALNTFYRGRRKRLDRVGDGNFLNVSVGINFALAIICKGVIAGNSVSNCYSTVALAKSAANNTAIYSMLLTLSLISLGVRVGLDTVYVCIGIRMSVGVGIGARPSVVGVEFWARC